jgi:alpha-beta hydrolase superfamily lysophospholipase
VNSSSYYSTALAGEGTLAIYPKMWRPDGTGKALIYAHGFGGSALECRRPSLPEFNMYALVEAAVEAGYAVLSSDFGGSLWGNSSHLSKITAAVGYLGTAMGANTSRVGFIGQSMGHVAAMNWAAQNRARTAFVVSTIGVADLANINGQSKYTDSITAAYGQAYTDAALGATYNPSVSASSKFAGLPWLGWAGTADTTCPIARTRALAAAIGSTATLREMAGGEHDWASLSAIDVAATVDFMRANL